MIFLVTSLVRILVVLLVVRFVVRFVASIVRGYREAERKERPVREDRGELVRDPVCHTFLPRERALVALVAGRPQHFCSSACRDRALTAAS